MAGSEKTKTPKKFTFKMQNKLLFMFIVITLVFVALIVRLVYLNNEDGERYEKQVLSRQSYVSAVIPFKRGDILDRNGTVLATSVLQYKLILSPKTLLTSCTNEEYTATLLALEQHFGVSTAELNEKIRAKENSQYLVIQKKLGYQKVSEFQTKISEADDIKGVWFEQEYVRSYPLSTLACDLIGFSNSENTGFYGLEEYYNDTLNGINGREYGYYDSELNIERIVKKAENGNSLITTIDANVQRIVQENIAEFNATTGSKNIGIVVMNPQNGEIYAMASNEEYDLNNPKDLSVLYTEEEIAGMTEDEKMNALNGLWQNFCITYGYEPGSTFKPITVASALEENIVTDNSMFTCDGYGYYGGHTIRCVNRSGHGDLTLGEAVMKSCNDVMMQISNLEGKTLFSDYQERFSVGRKTGIDLPGEADGLKKMGEDMGPADLATYSFGQNFTTTMVQMASAFSSLVNGGNYYQPHLVKSIVTDQGATVSNSNQIVVRQTVSNQTSELLKKYLYWTVESGTAKTAQVEGYTIGGKTGTAEKQPRGNKKYLVSFIGCAPALNPEVVIYVVIDEAQNVDRQDNSSLATKLAAKVLNEIMPHLSIYPEGEIDYLLEELEEVKEEHLNNTTVGGEGTNDNPQTPGEDGANEGTENPSGNAEGSNAGNGTGETTGEPVTPAEDEDIEYNGGVFSDDIDTVLPDTAGENTENGDDVNNSEGTGDGTEQGNTEE